MNSLDFLKYLIARTMHEALSDDWDILMLVFEILTIVAVSPLYAYRPYQMSNTEATGVERVKTSRHCSDHTCYSVRSDFLNSSDHSVNSNSSEDLDYSDLSDHSYHSASSDHSGFEVAGIAVIIAIAWLARNAVQGEFKRFAWEDLVTGHHRIPSSR